MKMKEDLIPAAAKAAPPVVVTGSHVVFNLALSDWVAIATLIYICLQVFVLIRKELIKKKDDE